MTAAVHGGSKIAVTSISSPALEGRSNAGQDKARSCKEEQLQHTDQKDKVGLGLGGSELSIFRNTVVPNVKCINFISSPVVHEEASYAGTGHRGSETGD